MLRSRVRVPSKSRNIKTVGRLESGHPLKSGDVVDLLTPGDNGQKRYLVTQVQSPLVYLLAVILLHVAKRSIRRSANPLFVGSSPTMESLGSLAQR